MQWANFAKPEESDVQSRMDHTDLAVKVLHALMMSIAVASM